jgi:hypothetical protein
LVLVIASGCATPAPAATRTPQPTPNPPAAPVASSTPTSAPTATSSVGLLVDDFEAAATTWKAGTLDVFTDSSATGIALRAEHAAQGRQALQMDFELNDKPKAIFYIDRALDFSKAHTLRFDLFDPGTVAGVGFAVTTGPDAVWYESDSLPVEAGKSTTLSFDLTAGTYKAASTNWEFRASIADLNNVSRLAIIIYPSKNGAAYLDNILLSGPLP